MDYEQKYKAMLEQARDYHSRCQTEEAKRELEAIFPELRESEDERIRKWIVGYFTRQEETGINLGMDYCKIFAWLEKQKEQKPETLAEGVKEYTIREDYTSAYYEQKGYSKGYADGNRDAEQKPCGCVNVESEYDKGWRDGHKAGLKDAEMQKPAWSEEDEKNCNRIIRFLEPHKTFFPTKEIKEEMQNWLKNRLKSLRPQPHWKPSEEHLSALLAVLNDPNNIGSQTCQLALTDLYEQLKKL